MSPCPGRRLIMIIEPIIEIKLLGRNTMVTSKEAREKAIPGRVSTLFFQLETGEAPRTYRSFFGGASEIMTTSFGLMT
jgi:hypothetical protein